MLIIWPFCIVYAVCLCIYIFYSFFLDKFVISNVWFAYVRGLFEILKNYICLSFDEIEFDFIT